MLDKLDIRNHVDVIVHGNLYVEHEALIKPNGNLNVRGKICKVSDINNISGCEVELKIN